MNIYFLIGALALLLTVTCKPQKSQDTNLEEYGIMDDPNDMEDQYGDEDTDDIPDDEDLDDNDEVLPEMLSKSDVIWADQGQSITLPCLVKDIGQYVRVWKRSEEDILFQATVSLGKSNRFTLDDDEGLKIQDVALSDAGNYTCEVLITNSDKRSVNYSVVVKDHPKIVSLSSENNVTVFKKGDTMKLTCDVTGVPKPTISWIREKEKLKITGETLVIEDLRVKHAGRYRCFADNKSKTPAHASLEIKVESEPIIKIDKYMVNTDHNTEVELECTVKGSPTPTVNWQKNGVNLRADDHIHMTHKEHVNTLVIKNVTESDLGVYTCKAKNALGGTEVNITIVKEPAVLKLKGEKGSIVSFKVESKKPILKHEVQYRKKGEEKWEAVFPPVTTPDDHFTYHVQYNLQNLQPGTYEVRARSKNAHGWSVYSDKTEVISAKHHNKHHKKQKETGAKEHQPVIAPPTTPTPEITHKETPVGASQTGGSSTIFPSVVLGSISFILLLCCRQ